MKLFGGIPAIGVDGMSRAAGFGLGLIAFMGISLGAWSGPAWSQTGNPAQTQELSFSVVDSLVLSGPGDVAGMTWIGKETLVLLKDIPDTDTNSGDREVLLIMQNRQGKILRREDFTGVLDRGLAWDGDYLYSCGDAPDGSSILYQIEPDTLRVEEAFDVPGHRPVGMCWDGRFLWITDRDSGRVDRFDPEVKAITRSVVTPGFSPFGLTWDGLHMWVTDSGTGRMYRLAGSRRAWDATIDAESFLFRGRDVRLLHDGDSFWYVPAGVPRAYKIRFN